MGNYVEAHNQRDLEAIDKANAANFEGKAANGVIINGAEAHAAFLKEWFATSNPSWKYNYAMANDVPQTDGTIHHWGNIFLHSDRYHQWKESCL